MLILIQFHSLNNIDATKIIIIIILCPYWKPKSLKICFIYNKKAKGALL